MVVGPGGCGEADRPQAALWVTRRPLVSQARGGGGRSPAMADVSWAAVERRLGRGRLRGGPGRLGPGRGRVRRGLVGREGKEEPLRSGLWGSGAPPSVPVEIRNVSPVSARRT